MNSFLAMILADLARYTPERRIGLMTFARIAATEPGALAVLLHRIAHSLWPNHRGLSRLVRTVTVVVTGADVSPQARFGPGLKIAHPSGVVVGGGVKAGTGVTLFQASTLGRRRPVGDDMGDYPTLGDRVTVSANAVVLGGLDVGHDATIGAHSLVLSDVAEGEIVGGVPARALRLANRKI